MNKEKMNKIESKTNAAKAKRRIAGTALRDSKDKSVLIGVDITKFNSLYKKRFASIKKYLAHTENEVKAGQRVIIEETKPISKRKSWQIVEVKETA